MIEFIMIKRTSTVLYPQHSKPDGIAAFTASPASDAVPHRRL